MRPTATIQVTNIEFVTANPPTWTIGIGFNDTAGSCSPLADAASAASVVVASANPQSKTTTAKRKQRLRIFVSTAVAGIGDTGVPTSPAFAKTTADRPTSATT
jgi:hypothetical protein